MSKKALSRLVIGLSTGAVLGLAYLYYKRHRDREIENEQKSAVKKTVNFRETETVYNGNLSNSSELVAGDHIVISSKESPAEALQSVLEAAENEEKKIEQPQQQQQTGENTTDNSNEKDGPKPEDKSIIIEMLIAKDVVAGVIGKRGSNIKRIQSDSNTRINFKNETMENGDRICSIRGRADDVDLARDMIQKYVASQPVLTTKEIMVPYNTVGRIIGRSGETIRGIQDMSKCKVNVDSSRTEVRNDESQLFTIVTLRGTEDQISMAESLILEKVEEEKQFKNRIKGITSTRTPRRATTAAASNSSTTPNKNIDSQLEQAEQKAALRPEGITEVFVSCVYHPNMFWIQILGRDSIELDKLGEAMTDYYCRESPRESQEEPEADFLVGDIVAAPFQDEKMYRAKIDSLSEDGKVAEVEYVDYGDRRDIEVQQLRTLLPSFLDLKFQAIEATLNLTCTDSLWPDDAITKFCDLSYCAQWKSLTGKVKGFLTEQEPTKRTIVWLELMDKDVNLGAELIKEGLAGKEEGRGGGGSGRNRKSSGNANSHHRRD